MLRHEWIVKGKINTTVTNEKKKTTLIFDLDSMTGLDFGFVMSS